jgi:signal transduction histidine kinase
VDLPLRIEQVLTNLLDNAVKYSPHGGRIAVEVRRAEGGVQITVSDKGRGVASEHRVHIFDRFYRGDSEAGIPGLGLGLYISCSIAEAHGGSLTADLPGAGASRFTLSIPIDRT